MKKNGINRKKIQPSAVRLCNGIYYKVELFQVFTVGTGYREINVNSDGSWHKTGKIYFCF